MTTRHHTSDGGEDQYATSAEAISAFDADLACQREVCRIDGTWDDDALGNLAWSIEIDRATEGPRSWVPCECCETVHGDLHSRNCDAVEEGEMPHHYEATEYTCDWTRQQVPDLADRLVELLQARPELGWEVRERLKLVGPWVEIRQNVWARQLNGRQYAAEVTYWSDEGWRTSWEPEPFATLDGATAAADKRLVALGFGLVGGPVVAP